MSHDKPEVSERVGSCLCNAITVVAQQAHSRVGACHCGMCRNWGGGPYMEIDCGTDVRFEGEEHISVYASSRWAERGFCRQCGTHLFFRIRETGQHMMPVGLFDDQQDLVFDRQVFIDQKPGYYEFSNPTTDLTEAEIFAMYGAGSD